MYQDSETAVGSRAAEFWARDFALRMALVGPNDTLRGVFCNGLVRFARSLGCTETLSRCLETGGEEKFVDFFSYPATTYLRMLSTVVLPLAERQGAVEEALRVLGRQSLADLQRSAAGKALSMLNTGDMRSRLEVLLAAYRVALNFGQHSLAWTGATSARLSLRNVLMPCPFHEGMLLGMLDSASSRSVKVIGRQLGPRDVEFDITWE